MLEVSHIVGVGAPGGKYRNFQSRTRSISLHGCSTYGGTSHWGPIVKEKEEQEEEQQQPRYLKTSVRAILHERSKRRVSNAAF
jgi:hypothetical protein